MAMKKFCALALASVLASALAGCAAPVHAQPGVGPYSERRPVRVVTTTPLLADVVRNVGANRVDARSIVPIGADPHGYEPSLRDIRDIAYADLAVSNYLMLEEHSQIKAIDSTIGKQVRHVSVAEGATRYGAQVITLTENSALDTAWLGLRVRGGSNADRSAGVRIIATDMKGPGALSAYITETFGHPSVYVNSADGFENDFFELPTNAHTHMSWAFTKPGIYTLTLQAQTAEKSPKFLGKTTVRFAVGVDPLTAFTGSDAVTHSDVAHSASSRGSHGTLSPSGSLSADSARSQDSKSLRVLTHEHADITVDMNGGFTMQVDRNAVTPSATAPSGDSSPTVENLPMDHVVIEVPPKALQPVPADPVFRFIARPGTEVYQLPQAVLGSHIHGEIDPHLWMDVRNVKAYAALLRDELIRLDPHGAAAYTRACEQYQEQLDALDAEVSAAINAIPPHRRKLVTSYDAFGYLAHAYGIPVAGIVTPNPAVEPSVADRSRLVSTLRGLHIPAVFASPTDIRMRTPLVEIAEDVGVKVCPLLSDEFTPDVHTYTALMRFDAKSLRNCLA
ncbi:MAG: zinc ABC transporter substrate-binding protein [Arcanobacterium sp.]|nr:zinc ABC transporter substrate-binding protein [Arcanobacterium sp.]